MSEEVQKSNGVVLFVDNLSADELELGMYRIRVSRIGRLCMGLDEKLKGFFIAIVGDDCEGFSFKLALMPSNDVPL